MSCWGHTHFWKSCHMGWKTGLHYQKQDHHYYKLQLFLVKEIIRSYMLSQNCLFFAAKAVFTWSFMLEWNETYFMSSRDVLRFTWGFILGLTWKYFISWVAFVKRPGASLFSLNIVTIVLLLICKKIEKYNCFIMSVRRRCEIITCLYEYSIRCHFILGVREIKILTN